jgi:hypothetical protein
MTREQKLREIEKIWKKHTSGGRNMIGTFLPHANYMSYFNELVDFFDEQYPDGITLDDVRKAAEESIKEKGPN